MIARERTLRSFDGTRIAWQSAGPSGQPPVFLANGVGGRMATWFPLLGPLADRQRWISWDYRGTFASDVPGDRRRLTVRDHAADLAALMDEVGADEAAVMGWSMGVQVGLEFALRHPKRCRGLAAFNGTAGEPFTSALGGFAPGPLLRLGLRSMGPAGPLLRLGLSSAVRSPLTIPFLKASGLLAWKADGRVARQIGRELAGQDFGVLARLVGHLAEHSVWDHLDSLRLPVLVVTGSRDLLVSPAASRRMAREIPGAELLIVPGGTHYTPIEFPQVIAPALVEFLDRCRAPSAAGASVR